MSIATNADRLTHIRRQVSLAKLFGVETHELSAAQAAELWPMMHNAMHRIPALEQAQVKMLVNGPERFTPDGAFLLGEAPEVKGFYVGCGMNSVGVASGGGAGRALAEWIVDGAPAIARR